MLRRKLLLGLGSLIAAFAVLSIGAVLLLERLLNELDESRATITTYISRLHELGGQVIDVEAKLTGIGSPDAAAPRPEELRFIAEYLRRGAERLKAEDIEWPADSAGPRVRDRLIEALPRFADRVEDAADNQVEDGQANADALVPGEHVWMQSEILNLTRLARAFASDRQAQITWYFRWVVLGIAVAAIIVVNISVLVVLRITGMVLRPVDLLIRAGGEWAEERFGHRVPADLPGEFGQLAATYNHLAEQLAANEKRRLETLHQAARMLNHELNNALAIIELQVHLLHRRPQETAELADRLAHIRDCLARMSGTIAALKSVRRIVLTDYLEGEKMLDLPRSVDDHPEAPHTVESPQGAPP